MALTPSTEVLGVKVGSLSRGETVFGVSSRAYGVLARVQVSCDLCEALWHEAFVDKATDLSRIVGHVLLAHLMGRATDPVHRVLAVVTVDFAVDVLGRRQLALLLSVAPLLQTFMARHVATGQADFSVNAAGSFAEHDALSGHEACVAWQVLSLVRSGRSVGCSRHLLEIFKITASVLLLNLIPITKFQKF